MTDPVTGQTVCSCQYDSAARLALGAYPRLTPTATTYSSYPTPTPSSTDQGPYPSIGMDSSALLLLLLLLLISLVRSNDDTRRTS